MISTGPLLYRHSRVGSQPTRVRGHHQGHADLRRRQGLVRRPLHPRRLADLRSCWCAFLFLRCLLLITDADAGNIGRPQYESQGVGYICTTSDKLDHYTQAIMQQHPIESKCVLLSLRLHYWKSRLTRAHRFIEGLVDSLNAEISLGTVTTVDEGSRWLSYSYLFVRMQKNPMVYGIQPSDVVADPRLGARRRDLITISAKRLEATRMAVHDKTTDALVPTDLGRIASRYYIKNASIEIYNGLFEPVMNEARVLALIAASVEFAQVAVRESEIGRAHV